MLPSRPPIITSPMIPVLHNHQLNNAKHSVACTSVITACKISDSLAWPAPARQPLRPRSDCIADLWLRRTHKIMICDQIARKHHEISPSAAADVLLQQIWDSTKRQINGLIRAFEVKLFPWVAGSTYYVNSAMIVDLRQSGVSDRRLHSMQLLC